MQPPLEEAIKTKMRVRGISETGIESFLRMVRRAGQKSPYIPLEDVCAPSEELLLKIPEHPEVFSQLEEAGEALLSKAVVIKLNGGRSTTMGGEVPKGILVAKDGMSYLEIILGQMKAIRDKWSIDIPLVLMNSFFTQTPTMEVIKQLGASVRTIEQKQVPRLLKDTLIPLDTGTDDDWAPPGHGDVYESLSDSGLLDELLSEGYQWAFISNVDNLAANLEPWILGLIQKHDAGFLMEVTDRTNEDRKGGTLVVGNDRLQLLEIAQVDPKSSFEFMDIDRFRVFNTNNIWVDLIALRTIIDQGLLNLPIMQNHKKIRGANVVQLETAMGSAIGSFPRARGLKVNRDRFFPTKKVEDLFVLQSDVCLLDPMYRLRRNSSRLASLPPVPAVSFGSDFLDSPLRISERFEDSTTISLLNAESLKVSGSVFFERDVRIEGNVSIEASPGKTLKIESGAILKGGNYS
jgi:UTP--glucose-1-phosphate uridylyltransferase